MKKKTSLIVGSALFLTILLGYNKINHDRQMLSASQRRFDEDYSIIKQHLARLAKIEAESKINDKTNVHKSDSLLVSNYPKNILASKIKIQLLLYWYSQIHGLDHGLISNVAYVESNWNASAISPAGAVGLMQIMPETALKYGLKNIYNIQAYIDVHKKFKRGILPYSEFRAYRLRYAEALKHEIKGKTFEEIMLIDDRFDPEKNVNLGTRCLKDLLIRYQDNKRLALAAYNAGEEAVSLYKDVPPFSETVAYINKIQGR